MDENRQPTTEVDRLSAMKTKLFNMIQEDIPEPHSSMETVTLFMQTGVLPSVWLQELFKRNISPKKLNKIHDLMYKIHIDPPEEEKNGQQAKPGNQSVPPMKTDPLANTATTPEKPGKKPPRKKKLNEGDLAKILFSGFISSALDGKNILELTKLRTLVSQKLVGHSIGYNPQKEMLTLYDEDTRPVASFRTQKMEVVSE